jgi:hypothetical protein
MIASIAAGSAPNPNGDSEKISGMVETAENLVSKFT